MLAPLRLLLFALALGTAPASASPGSRPRIVGGAPATRQELPFIASLGNLSGHICGGSLIRPNWVLTAAHCVVPTKGEPDLPSITRVYIGMRNRFWRLLAHKPFTPKRVIAHPRYDQASRYDYDLALIELDRPAPGPLAKLGRALFDIDPDNPPFALIGGWGNFSDSRFSISPNTVNSVRVPVLTPDDCRAQYGPGLTDGMFCAGYARLGGKGSCFGDSGGPVVLESDPDVLVGVVSFGKSCARPGAAGVNARVASAVDWIESVVSSPSASPH